MLPRPCLKLISQRLYFGHKHGNKRKLRLKNFWKAFVRSQIEPLEEELETIGGN